MTDLTKIILDLIKERGLTKAKVERDCGFGNGTIGRWEKGLNNPSETAIDKLSNYFGVSIQYTIANETKKDSPDGLPLSDDEAEFIRIIRGLPEEDRQKLKDFGHLLERVHTQ